MKTRFNLINTSNKGKKAEFTRLFSQYDYQLGDSVFKSVDLPEIDADAETVAAMKAKTAAEKHGVACVLIDDTSLDIAGHPDASVNIRKWLDESPEKFASCVGLSATFRCILAFTEDNQIAYLAMGEVLGHICEPKFGLNGQGFGFDPVFQPNGSDESLAQAKPDKFNARALAVQSLFANKLKSVVIPEQWDQWQDIQKNKTDERKIEFKV